MKILYPTSRLKRSLIVALFLLTLAVSYSLAQGQANHWPFSNSELNFSTDTVLVTRGYADHRNRGMGAISDADGNLLLYTDGFSAFTRNHQVMPNGTGLITGTNLSSVQESIIIPKPNSSTIFYIFTVDPDIQQASSGLYYATVDLSLNGGLGDVTTKGTRLVSKTSNNLSATFHENGKDVWVIAHQNRTNTYCVVSVTDQGVSPAVAQYSLGSAHEWLSQLKFAPDGKKIAVQNSSEASGIDVFDFDKTTGALSNPMHLSLFDSQDVSLVSGLEFSSDAKKIYTSDNRSNRVFQFDLSSGTEAQINKSRYALLTPLVNNDFYQLQLGPDGRIYATKGAGGDGTGYLGVIDNPNSAGPEVKLREQGVYLRGADAFVNLTPNFIQDYFYKTSFRINGSCQGAPIDFRITNDYHVDSVRWTFGEGSSSRERNPQKLYNTPGQYQIKLIAYYKGVASTIIQKLTIKPYTAFSLGNDTTVCKHSPLAAKQGYSSYRWSTGDTSRFIHLDQSGQLVLTTVNEVGCAFSDSVAVTVVDRPVLALADTIFLAGRASVQVDAGDFKSYRWNTNATTRTLTLSQSAWYSVEVTNEASCSAATSFFIANGNTTPATPEDRWVLLNPLPSSNTGTDMFFLDDENGFIVNGSELLYTKDRGDHWAVQMKMPGVRKIKFKNSIGYAVGDFGAVYKSTQNGGGWNKLNFPFTESLIAISVLHPDTLRMIGTSTAFMSNDGGSTWTTATLAPYNPTDCWFTSAKIGHVVCQRGVILKTTDGGRSWALKLSTNIVPSDFFKVQFINKNIGFASRQWSTIFKTMDGGETWNPTFTNLSMDAYAMQFPDENIGFIAGQYGVVARTLDAGKTWTTVGYDGTDASDVYGLFAVNENQVYATGLGGRIIRTFNGGAKWSRYALTNFTVSQIQFTSDQTGYFSAGKELFKTSNRSEFLKIPQPFQFVDRLSFDFVNDNTGFIVGYPDLSGVAPIVFKTTDGGSTWNKTHSSEQIFDGIVQCLEFVDEQTGFIGGSSGVYKTVDGGATWAQISSGDFVQMQFLDGTIGYARGGRSASKSFFKTTDGGVTWVKMITVDDSIEKINFVDALVGYFVGSSDLMYKTVDGGVSWQQLHPPFASFTDVKFINARQGYITENYGAIYYTSDGGASWQTEPLTKRIRMLGLSGSDVYAAGDFGNVLRHSRSISDKIILASLAQAGAVTDHVTLTSHVTSSIDLSSAPLYADLRIGSGGYGPPIQIELLQGKVDKALTVTLSDLEPQSIYHCRFRIDLSPFQIATEEYVFATPSITTGVEDAYKNLFSLYPNPTRDVTIISASDPETAFRFTVTDLLGRTIIKNNAVGEATVSLKEFSTGIYILIIDDGVRKISRRLIRE